MLIRERGLQLLLLKRPQPPLFGVVTEIYILLFFFLEILQYKTSKEGSTVGVTVSHSSLLAQCQALTQACGYMEGKVIHSGLQLILPARHVTCLVSP